MFVLSVGSGMFVVSTWLQHGVLVTDKHGVHFPVLEGILIF